MTFRLVPTSSEQAPGLDWLAVIFFASIHLLALLAPWFFSWSALGVALFLHWLFGSIGICLGYHRLLSHRSFQVPQWLEYAIAFIGALALQGGPIFWVAGHRLHHAYTEDEVKDPYSARRGFWWSHMLWIFYPHAEFFDYDRYQRYASDLVRDPFYRWLNRYFIEPIWDLFGDRVKSTRCSQEKENGVLKRPERQRVGNNRAITAPKEENKTASMDEARNPQWHLLPTQERL